MYKRIGSLRTQINGGKSVKLLSWAAKTRSLWFLHSQWGPLIWSFRMVALAGAIQTAKPESCRPKAGKKNYNQARNTIQRLTLIRKDPLVKDSQTLLMTTIQTTFKCELFKIWVWSCRDPKCSTPIMTLMTLIWISKFYQTMTKWFLTTIESQTSQSTTRVGTTKYWN